MTKMTRKAYDELVAIAKLAGFEPAKDIEIIEDTPTEEINEDEFFTGLGEDEFESQLEASKSWRAEEIEQRETED